MNKEEADTLWSKELLPLNPFDKRKVEVALERFTNATSKFNVEKYRFATVVDGVIRAGFSMDSVLTEDEQNELLDWKRDFEVELAASQAAANERFAQTDAIRKARKNGR